MRSFAILVVLTRVAAADPPPSPPPIPAQPWSWAPLVSVALYDHQQAALSAELRVRHSTEADFDPSTISLGIEARTGHPIDPYIMFGADSLHHIEPHPNSHAKTFRDVHVGIGGGYDDRGGFVLARLSAGVILARPADGHYYAGYSTLDRHRLSSQADLVLEVRASDGELRIGFGFDLDPRFLPQFLKEWW